MPQLCPIPYNALVRQKQHPPTSYYSVDLILIQPNISSDTQVTLARAKLLLCLPVLYKKCTLAHYNRCIIKKINNLLPLHTYIPY